MLKKILIFILLLLIPPFSVSAQTNPLESQIDELKDRIASRVAELKLVEKRGIVGVVTAASQTQITLTDSKDETRFIDVDELTKFEGEASDFGISDIQEGQTLGVLGLYNKQSRRLLARVVSQVTLPRYINGVVEAKDEDEFTITVASEDDQLYVVDVETTTRTYEYTKEDGIVRSGFSKIEPGLNVIVSGFPSRTNSKATTGDRILIFPEIPKNPKVAIETEISSTPSATPSAR